MREREFAMRQAAQAFDEQNRNRVFAEGQRQFDIGTGQYNRQLDIREGERTGPNSTAAIKQAIEDQKSASEDLAYGFQSLYDRAKTTGELDTTNPVFQAQPPVRQKIAIDAAQETRDALRPLLERRALGVEAGNRIARMETNVEAIKKTPKSTLLDRYKQFAGFRGFVPNPGADTSDLEQRIKTLRTTFGPLLSDPSIARDPATKQYSTSLPNWFSQELKAKMAEAANAAPPGVPPAAQVPRFQMDPRTSPVSGMFPQQTSAIPRFSPGGYFNSPVAPPVAPQYMNPQFNPRAWMPPQSAAPMTGTNGVIGVRLSDGRVVFGPAEAIPALLQRDPGAVRVQ